jgi:hypothetical protein
VSCDEILPEVLQNKEEAWRMNEEDTEIEK